MREKTSKYEYIIGTILFIISISAVIMMACQIGGDDIWYDEVFSMGFIRYGVRDICALTARDVHPPLYYIYLKGVVSLLTGFLPGVSSIVAAKIASIIPWFGLLIISATYVRKTWGYMTMGLYAFLVTLMPQIGNYYVEVRMYSLALLLITCAGLMAYSIVDNKNIYKWIAFTVLGLLTAYTQYYACIAIVGIYIALGICLFMEEDTVCRKRSLVSLGICALVSVCIYMPWIPEVISQMNTLSGNYWIQPLTLRSIAGCIKFIILPVAWMMRLCIISAILIVASCIIAICLWIRKGVNKKDLHMSLVCLLPLTIVIVSGFILSLAGTPIFVYRYMVPTLGLIWLWVSIVICNVSEKYKWMCVLLIPFLLEGALVAKGFYDEEHKKVVQWELGEDSLDSIEEDSTLVCNFDHVAAVMSYYMEDCDVRLYNGEIDALIPDITGGGDSIIDEEILDLIDNNKSVYFIGSFNARDEIVEDWAEMGIASELVDSVLIERYWVNIYKLGR